jgi:S1-C subfamily serine protease
MVSRRTKNFDKVPYKTITLKRAIMISLAIHVLLFMPVAFGGCSGRGSYVEFSVPDEEVNNQGSSESQNIDVNIIPKSTNTNRTDKAKIGFYGIGAIYVVDVGDYTPGAGKYVQCLINVIEGYPAYNAGLKVNDVIVAVNGQTMSDTTSAHEKIIGQQGGYVTLTVYRPSTHKTFTVRVDRAFIETDKPVTK